MKDEAIERLESSAQAFQSEIKTLTNELSRNESASELLKKHKDAMDKKLRRSENRLLGVEAIILNIQNNYENILKEHKEFLDQTNDRNKNNSYLNEKMTDLELKYEEACEQIIELRKRLEAVSLKLVRFEERFGENSDGIRETEKNLMRVKENKQESKLHCDVLDEEMNELYNGLQLSKTQVNTK